MNAIKKTYVFLLAFTVATGIGFAYELKDLLFFKTVELNYGEAEQNKTEKAKEAVAPKKDASKENKSKLQPNAQTKAEEIKKPLENPQPIKKDKSHPEPKELPHILPTGLREKKYNQGDAISQPPTLKKEDVRQTNPKQRAQAVEKKQVSSISGLQEQTLDSRKEIEQEITQSKTKLFNIIRQSIPSQTLEKIQKTSEYTQRLKAIHQFLRSDPRTQKYSVELAQLQANIESLEESKSKLKSLLASYILSFTPKAKQEIKEQLQEVWEQILNKIRQSKQIAEKIISELEY